jgi:heptosyltransferase-1
MRMARLAANGKRVGLANATEGSGYESISRIFHDLSVPVHKHTHAVLRARLVAAAALGYSVDGQADFNLRNADASKDVRPAWLPTAPYAVFFHGTARAAKQWPAVHWIEIAQKLSARRLQILLPWGSEEEKRAAHQLASRMSDAVVLPKLSMMEAVTLAQRAALVIGVDTGLTHIAAAFNRPTIELYCDSPRWKTQGDWSPNIINLGDLGTPPRVADVENAINALLGTSSNTQSRSG